MGRSRSRSRSRGRRSRRSGGERSKKRSKRSRSRSRSRDRRKRREQSPDKGSKGGAPSFDASAVKAALAAMDSQQNLANALNQAMAADPSAAMATVTQAVAAGLNNNAAAVTLVTASPMLASQKQSTRAARRLYIGNLPAGIGLNENMLIEFFASSLKQFGMLTEKPIMGAAMRLDQSFCFLEFRCVRDVEPAMSLLQGLTLGVCVLKVAKPSDWGPAPPELADFEVPVAHAVATMAMPAVNPFVAPPAAAVVAASPVAAPLYSQPKYPFHPNPKSNVIVLVDIVLTAEEALDSSDIISDVHWESTKYGGVKSVTFPPDLQALAAAAAIEAKAAPLPEPPAAPPAAPPAPPATPTEAAALEATTPTPPAEATAAMDTTEADAAAPAAAPAAPPAAPTAAPTEAAALEATAPPAEATAAMDTTEADVAATNGVTEVDAAATNGVLEADAAAANGVTEADAAATNGVSSAEKSEPNNTSETPTQESAEASAEAPVEESATDTPTEEPADAAEVPAATPAATPTEEPADTPAATPADTPAEEPAATPEETPEEIPADTPAAPTPEAPQYQATNCFITFDNMKSAGCALLALRKRGFNMRHLNPRFFNAEAYQKGDLSLEHLIAD